MVNKFCGKILELAWLKLDVAALINPDSRRAFSCVVA
jgi:hypothetical protein